MTRYCQLYIWLLVHLFLGLHTNQSYAAVLTWPDAPDGRLHRIDTDKKTLEVETRPGIWQLQGVIELQGVVSGEFPSPTRVESFPVDSTIRLLLVNCTQQVYQFNRQTRRLERLDKTFFRGYNCHSAKFIRKSILHSFGGYGFWHTNNILSYYKAATNEWESLNSATNAPASIYQGFNGYVPEVDAFISALSFHQNDSEHQGGFHWDEGVYQFSFADNTWRKVGQTSPAVREHLQFDILSKASWFQINRYFILCFYNNPLTTFLVFDAVRNEARLWRDTDKLLGNVLANGERDVYHSYVWQNTLHFRRNVADNSEAGVRIIKLPIAQIWRDARPIGAFYETEDNTILWAVCTLGALVLVGIGANLFWRWRHKKAVAKPTPSAHQEPTRTSQLSVLNPQEKEVFEALLRAQTTGGISGEQLNELLKITDKTLDNQRRVRADVIKGINLKIKLLWDISEAVERVPTTLDRRMFTYIISNEVVKKIDASQES